jgi:HD superfamily phosphohydrolase
MKLLSKIPFTKILLFFCFSLPYFSQATLYKKLIYTTIALKNSVIIDLVKSQAFKRLEHVHQYGIDSLTRPTRAHSKVYNRYNHSLGVYWLTQRYGAPLNEQVAALLHDASHTAFSHVGDRIFDHKDGKNSYQDDHHLEFLRETDIPQILAKHSLTLNDIDHKNPKFTCLEQPLPDICADRLEYNLAGGVIEGLITEQEVFDILDHLKFENNRWYFTDVAHAQKFAAISLWHTEHVWGSQMGNYVSQELAQAIRKALELNILTYEEVIYGTDAAVWNKLCPCNNAEINIHIQKLLHAHEHEAEINLQPRNNKFRGIDPWVLVNGEFKRLTELDEEFRQEYERIKVGSY